VSTSKVWVARMFTAIFLRVHDRELAVQQFCVKELGRVPDALTNHIPLVPRIDTGIFQLHRCQGPKEPAGGTRWRVEIVGRGVHAASLKACQEIRSAGRSESKLTN
jgi:hypothetical protein